MIMGKVKKKPTRHHKNMTTSDSTKLYVREEADKERQRSDEMYALKIIERIVYGMLGTVCLAVLYALLQKINL